MDSFWLAGVAALLLVAGATLLRSWHAPRRLPSALPGDAVPRRTTEAGGLELGAEIRHVLARLAPLARDHGVTFTFALGPQLITWAEPVAFRRALSGLLEHAISRTPNGSVLVSAGQQAGRMRVSVSDDGPLGDESGARTALRSVSEFLASQGGSLEIDNRPGEGMTVTMRLPTAWAVDPDTMPFARPGTSAASPA